MHKLLIIILLWPFLQSYGQAQHYDYKRKLEGISGEWHKVTLPDDIFGKLQENLADIRIMGVTASNDTLEVPYLLRQASEKTTHTEVDFKTLNSSHNAEGYHFTFEVPTEEIVNQIKLGFGKQNFDWKLKLEGSQNQQEWFALLEDYRILSIKNESTDFQFTKINFSDSKYNFLKISIQTQEKPELLSAKISQHKLINGTFKKHTFSNVQIDENKKLKQTEIKINLDSEIPLSHIKINVEDNFDYYRPITIKYLSDSFKTKKGWQYRYSRLTSGTLNSLEENEFTFSSRILQKLKIIIQNNDNQPLKIGQIEARWPEHELFARFSEPATYYLLYGNPQSRKPQYDISHFENKIPKAMTALNFGSEEAIPKVEIPQTEPLFKNKIWLWVVMLSIILLLGWFTVKMMNN